MCLARRPKLTMMRLGWIDLNPNYLTSGIQENPYSKTINFNASFDNNYLPRTYFDYETDIKVGDNDIVEVQLKGSVKSRGDLSDRWNLVKSYFPNVDIYGLALNVYQTFGYSTGYPLNNNQLSYIQHSISSPCK